MVTNIGTIVNSQLDKTNKPIANSLLVDQLLSDCSDLIEQPYSKWFAKRFYKLNPNRVLEIASIARVDGKEPKRLFVYLISKERI